MCHDMALEMKHCGAKQRWPGSQILLSRCERHFLLITELSITNNHVIFIFF